MCKKCHVKEQFLFVLPQKGFVFGEGRITLLGFYLYPSVLSLLQKKAKALCFILNATKDSDTFRLYRTRSYDAGCVHAQGQAR